MPLHAYVVPFYMLLLLLKLLVLLEIVAQCAELSTKRLYS